MEEHASQGRTQRSSQTKTTTTAAEAVQRLRTERLALVVHNHNIRVVMNLQNPARLVPPRGGGQKKHADGPVV